MTSLSHRSAELIAADLQAGRASEAERMKLELHLQHCERCAARHERLGALVTALRADHEAGELANDGADRRIVMQAMMQAGSRHDARPRRSAGRARYLWAAAGACAVAASVWMFWAAGVHGPEQPVSQRSVTTPQTPRLAPEAPTAPNAPVMDAPCRGVHTKPSADVEAAVAVSREHLCRLTLDDGTLLVHVDPEAEQRVSIDTPSASVRVVGTVFRVSVEHGQTRVVVYRGEVEVETRGARARLLSGRELETAGAELEQRVAEREALMELAAFVGEELPAEPSSTSERTPPATTTSHRARRPVAASPQRSLGDLRRMLRTGHTAEARAQAGLRVADPEYAGRRSELLTIIAESHALEAEYGRALESYRRVWAGPRSATAANALLAAAAIAIDRLGRPAEARRLYERYLQDYPEGSLRGAAWVGRCRALRRGGEREQAVTCAREYLRAHPDGRFRRQAESLAE
ncbi:MAG: FecR domain-containing protein [Deltaproteobacteria bacterium]|nr:FecR domain-containing protein [Deltaproteobacteria bacterium]